jgi:hypothetical protein
MIKMVGYSPGYTGPAERLATLIYLFANIVAATGYHTAALFTEVNKKVLA